MYKYRSTSHVLHFILTMVTGGFWIIPWVLFALMNRNHNDKIDLAMMQQRQAQPHTIIIERTK